MEACGSALSLFSLSNAQKSSEPVLPRPCSSFLHLREPFGGDSFQSQGTLGGLREALHFHSARIRAQYKTLSKSLFCVPGHREKPSASAVPFYLFYGRNQRFK